MRKVILFLLSLVVLPSVALADQLTAFPGADGYGKFTTGGRGGEVCYVTTLEDCTDADLVPGTLRWAIRHDNGGRPRTILFNVCGTIYLTSKLKLQYPDVTIAGQAAPGGGVCIAGCNIYVCKDNVILRHLRFRASDVPSSNYPCLDVENCKRIIIDHCSFTWSMEECLTMYDTDSTTVQWCIIGEGLYNSKHKKGERSYATQWGGEHSTMHHTLISNCVSRTPRFNGVRDESHIGEGKHDHDAQVTSEYANNVLYNWGKSNSAYGGELAGSKNKCETGEHMLGFNHVYMLDNYYVPGPTTALKLNLGNSTSNLRFVEASAPYGLWYLDGNLFSVDCSLNTDNMQKGFSTCRLDTVQTLAMSAYETAEDAYVSVCAGAGASLPRYDEQDARMLAEAAGRRTPQFVGPTEPTWLGIIDSQHDIVFENPDTFMVGTETVVFPSLAMVEGESLIEDTDQDGMPDAWETLMGLNPNDATDGNMCTLSTLAGYTNLEYYLNGGDGEMASAIPTYVIPVHPTHEAPEALENLYLRNAQKVIRGGQMLIHSGADQYEITGKKY